MYKLILKPVASFLLFFVIFLYPEFGNNTYAATIFQDNFNRQDNSTLGEDWIQFYGGQPSGVQNNQGYIDVGAGGLWGLFKVNDLNIQDQDVSVTFTHQNGDTTLLARVIDLNNRIAVNYYQSGGLQIYEVNNGSYRLIPNSAPNAVIGETYTFRVRVVGNSLKVWVNGIQHADALLNQITSGSAGFGANDGYTRVFFDNFIVEDASENTPYPEQSDTPTPSSIPTSVPTATPTFEPTPTSTPTPSPTATGVFLSVPSLKQYSVPWKNKIYDHTKSTINEFGCALTSAAMILQYHGHIVLPDALNNWLKNEHDGYIRNGLINWLAVSRYTKINDSTNSPTLEYKRLEPTNENLDIELNNSRPAILKEDGHFVVATGKLPSTYSINDPGYADRNTLEPYSNTFLAINSFTPTHSDLSYMMFVVDTDINLELFDSSGSAVSTKSFIDEPITNLSKPNKKSGETVKIYLLEKPKNDKYTLKVSGAKGNYQLDSYLYTTNGKLTQNEFKGTLKSKETDKYLISFEGRNKIDEKNDKKHKDRDYDDWFKYFYKYFKKWY